MPRIYELPAQKGSADPRRMMANQMDMELNNITREFDVNISTLDQQQLEPDKYKTQYANLQRQAMNQRVAIQAKHQATAQHIKNMQKLVEDRMLSPEQMQATMLVMAGVDRIHVKAMFAQTQRAKPSTRLNELDSMGKKLVAFQQQFEDYRGPHLFRGKEREKLYYTDPTGIKRKASKAEIEAYDDITTQIAALDREKAEIFSQLTPLEQFSTMGSRAVERFGMGHRPMPTGRWGMPTPEPVPKKKEPTVTELRKQGTREAYEKGIKLGYWQ